MEALEDFIGALQISVDKNEFVKITFSKPKSKSANLQNVYVRKVVIKGESKFSTTYRYKTNDQVSNYSIEELIEIFKELLQVSFRNVTLFTLSGDYALQKNKKGKISIKSHSPTFSDIPEIHHDEQKNKRSEDSKYLFQLGVTDKNGKVIPKMADKFRQINKYLEIVENLIKQSNLPQDIHIVDMGSGKGYLTFALYDYLNNTLKYNATVTGIELREDLVAYCTEKANLLEFANLNFISKPIQEYTPDNKIDILIALHACDTATDDAIFKGLSSNSQLIICAPCCHKQIRQSVKGLEFKNPVLKYGIFKEREFEMITDTIRALLMEENGYKTNIFEFISNEHTRKNIMLSGIRMKEKKSVKGIKQKIDRLKSDNSIEFHYLEKLIESSN